MYTVPLDTIIFNQIKAYRGNEFQEFGDRLLSKLFPEEYIAVRAGGPLGDLKNDGYCHISRIFFHFYGSSQNNISSLKAKITADIEGCLARQQKVEKIAYVTNDANLGAIEAHIDDLRQKHRLTIDTWGPSRLVEIIRPLPIRDIGSILKMALSEEPVSITYARYTEFDKVYTRKQISRRAWIAALSGISFCLIFYYGYRPLPFLWYLVILFLLLFVFLYMKWYISLPVRTHDGATWQRGSNFYIKEDEHYKCYYKRAFCPYPNCGGTIDLDTPPERETHRFKLVGYCSSNRTIHTFSYNDQNIGYPVTLNFEPETKK